MTVGQLNLKTVDVEDLALPGALLRKNLLVQLGIVRACEKIDFEGKTLRHDIGLRALRGRDAWDA